MWESPPFPLSSNSTTKFTLSIIPREVSDDETPKKRARRPEFAHCSLYLYLHDFEREPPNALQFVFWLENNYHERRQVRGEFAHAHIRQLVASAWFIEHVAILQNKGDAYGSPTYISSEDALKFALISDKVYMRCNIRELAAFDGSPTPVFMQENEMAAAATSMSPQNTAMPTPRPTPVKLFSPGASPYISNFGGEGGGGEEEQSTPVTPRSAPSSDLLADMQKRLWHLHFDSNLCKQLDVGVKERVRAEAATLNVRFFNCKS